jgi:predicted Rossmann fold nucleotide-binding protein DprA/Smf involved in DNA uptake
MARNMQRRRWQDPEDQDRVHHRLGRNRLLAGVAAYAVVIMQALVMAASGNPTEE